MPSLDFEVHEDLVPADMDLIGMDSNAMHIMGAVSRALKDAGNSKDVINWYMKESMSGDYDHLLRVAMVATGNL
jgi:hypothetical protein